MSLIESEMPINKIASLLGVFPKRIWIILNYWLRRAYHADDQSSIKTIGIDETSRKKGHDYLMITADLDQRRVVFACPGKDEKTIGQLAEHLKNERYKQSK